MKFAICNEIFGDWPLEQAFAYAKQAGYDGIEIAPFTLAPLVTNIPPKQRQEIRTLAARHQLAVSGIHWVLARTEGFHLTSPDEAVRERTGRYLIDLVRFCADLGGEFIVLGSPKQRQLLEGVSRDQGSKWALGCLRPAVREAEKQGITVCFEPLAPSETNFINTAAEAIQLVGQAASPSLKIILDVKAMSSEAKPIPQIIRESWPHFAYFHANDPNLKGPGFGEMRFEPIAAALREVGYNGWVSVEVFSFAEGPQAIASRSLEYLRQAFAPGA